MFHLLSLSQKQLIVKKKNNSTKFWTKRSLSKHFFSDKGKEHVCCNGTRTSRSHSKSSQNGLHFLNCNNKHIQPMQSAPNLSVSNSPGTLSRHIMTFFCLGGNDTLYRSRTGKKAFGALDHRRGDPYVGQALLRQ